MSRRVRGARRGLLGTPGEAISGGADEAGHPGQARRRTQPKHLTCDKCRGTGTQTRNPQLSQSAQVGFKRWAIFPRLDLIQSRLNRLNISIWPLLAPLGFRKDEASP